MTIRDFNVRERVNGEFFSTSAMVPMGSFGVIMPEIMMPFTGEGG